MSKQIFTDARLFVGGADLSGVSNKVEVSAELEAKEVTNFRSGGYKEFIAGLGSAKFNAEGFWEALDLTKVDDASFAALGAVGAWTACPTDATQGALAYFSNALETSYTLLGQVGDVAPYKVAADSSWPLVRGFVANPPGTARTITGTGTGVQLNAVSATQQLYAAVHVLSATGTTPSVTFAIESDTSNAFASPVTRLTFAAATTPGSQILRTPGAIAHTWYRAKWTITGTGPSILAAVVFGIQ